jgi:catechol 2,3-dioxygenase-like lactoylglutathione lyase family enzyme
MPAPRWFAHANVNAVDLEASERYYCDCFDLIVQGRTAPPEVQDGAGFGLPGVPVRWRGVFLADDRSPRGPVVDLLQWLEPPTQGGAYERADNAGLVAVRFSASYLDGVEHRLRDRGAPAEEWQLRAPDGRHDELLVSADPSGTRVEVVGREGPSRFIGLRVNCTDLERSVAFYQAALHLDAEPAQTVEVVTPDSVQAWTSQMLYLPGQRRQFSLELTQWASGVTGPPYVDGTHAGIYRTALVVADMDASYQELVQVVPDADPPVTVALGEGLADVEAVFFPDPDGAVLEFVALARR